MSTKGRNVHKYDILSRYMKDVQSASKILRLDRSDEDHEKAFFQMMDAVRGMANVPTAGGSKDWSKKIEALYHCFRFEHCDVNGQLFGSSTPDVLLTWSILQDVFGREPSSQPK
jgi:hypothetical protein